MEKEVSKNKNTNTNTSKSNQDSNLSEVLKEIEAIKGEIKQFNLKMNDTF